MITFNKDRFYQTVTTLLTTDSPSGYTTGIMNIIEEWTNNLGYSFKKNVKGTATITIPGKSNEKTVSLSAHVDTLGAMVRSITGSGNLKFTLVGGPIVPTLDSEYCTIYTRDGKKYTGTFLSVAPSAHVHKDSSSMSRSPETMEIRIDSPVKSKQDTLDLGISVGDYICIDTKTVVVNDFIKSRFLDDKASVACIFEVLSYLSENAIQPKFTTKVIISAFEEVGHGASHLDSDITEMLAVDMGCIGEDLTCTEFDVSICAKDSSGPYDYDMTSELISLAKEAGLSYAVDIYPYYGSDLSAALRAGNDIKGALIGPGVHASHGMERTHFSAIENTMNLIYLYLTK